MAAAGALQLSDPELHARASELFLALRALSADAREAELARVEDARVRAEVRSLLAHDVEPPPAEQSDPPLARIGPYRLIHAIGRGGTGRVYLAEQERPVARRVALKIVPQAAHDPELSARFEVERRALERTDHPGIARILDAGRTADGLPYLVMDYVEGAAITEHCAARGLSVRRRIELVREVADAVQHAHQRGVIHRDLKPANVLVSALDGRPRVVDFGVAKAVFGRLGSGDPLTLGLPIGTPAYMAPEQALGGEVGTRADVYALGALLYELVAGRPPIQADPDLLVTLARVRDAEPPPIAQHARELGRSRARDLDHVLSRALAKEPERRYASAAALGDDLGRLLASEPIHARAPSAAYRAARFAQRNRALSAALGAAVLALLLGVLGLAAGLREARRERAAALAQVDAQQALIRFLTEDLLAAAAPEREGADATVLDVLEAASARVDARFPGRPQAAAAVHHALGEAFAALGAFEPAERHLARALDLRRAHGSEADAVRSELAAASLLVRRERFAEALPLLEAAVARARDALGEDDEALYRGLNDLGVALESSGELDAAERALAEALDGRIRLRGAGDPAVLESTSNLALVRDARGETEAALALLSSALELATSLPETPRMTLLGLSNNVGAIYQDLGRDLEAAPHLRRAAEIARELLGPEHPATLTILGNQAGLEADLGDPERAAAIYADLVAARTESLGPDAPAVLSDRYGYWSAVAQAGRAQEAVPGLRALASDVERALGPGHWLLPHTRSALARALASTGRADEALPLALEAAESLAALLGPDHPRARSARRVADELGR